MSTGNFDTGFSLAVSAALKGAERGMAHAGMALMRDVAFEVPMIPKDKGDMQGSMSTFVGNKFIAAFDQPGPKSNPSLDLGRPVAQDAIVGTVGVNAPQAARLHEHPEYNFTEAPARGGKYVETKLAQFRDDYIKVIADNVKAALNG